MGKAIASFNEIVAHADAERAAGGNVVPLKTKAATRPARRPATRVWDESEVAKRALDLYALERTAVVAYDHAIERAQQFKEEHGLDRVDHKDEPFRRFTAEQWNSYLSVKGQVKLAKNRLTTACRNCLNGGEVRKEKYVDPRTLEDKKRLSELLDAIVAGTITMRDALAVRYSTGVAMVSDRAHFLAIQEDSDPDCIPF